MKHGPSAVARGGRHRGGDRRRARGGARARHRPSRSQAGEHLPDARRRASRSSTSASRCTASTALRPRRRPDHRAHRGGRRARHVRLHVARAGPRRARRRPQRHLRARLRALRDADRPPLFAGAHAAGSRSPSLLTTARRTSPPSIRWRRASFGRSWRAAVERDPARRFDSRAAIVAMALRALETRHRRVESSPRVGRSRAEVAGGAAVRQRRRRPEIEYLTDGITESIINSLSQLPRSSRRPAQPGVPIQGAAGGSRDRRPGAQRANDPHRTRQRSRATCSIIQAELVDTVDRIAALGRTVPAASSSDLVNVQEEIAWQISEALRLKLTARRRRSCASARRSTPRRIRNTCAAATTGTAGRPEGFRRALEHFERAIAHDPNYAPAYAGLGDTYRRMSYYGFIPPDDGFPARAVPRREKALALDPELGDAHGTLALGRLFWAGTGPRAERELQERRCSSNPQLATSPAPSTRSTSHDGRARRGDRARRGRAQLDPLSPLINMVVAWAHPLRRTARARRSARCSADARALPPGAATRPGAS